VPTEETKSRGAAASVTVRPFQIRGRFLTAFAFRVESTELDAAFYEALDAQLSEMPELLRDAPIILDMDKAPELAEPDAIKGLVAQLRERDFLVFGVQNASAPQLAVAREAGLIPVKVGRDAPMPEQKPSRSRKVDRLLPPDNKLIAAPVRSGQTVYAERGDLTIVGPVSSGAEIVASGSIHVYGPLRGRAIAGAHGDETARIFCQSLDAELLAIAGLYRTSESIQDELRQRSVQVVLNNDRLDVEAFG
jgi:septum site-determining protein MinC